MQPAPAVQQQTRADATSNDSEVASANQISDTVGAGADTMSVVDSMDGGKPLASPARSSGENLQGDPARASQKMQVDDKSGASRSAGTANGSY